MMCIKIERCLFLYLWICFTPFLTKKISWTRQTIRVLGTGASCRVVQVFPGTATPKTKVGKCNGNWWWCHVISFVNMFLFNWNVGIDGDAVFLEHLKCTTKFQTTELKASSFVMTPNKTLENRWTDSARFDISSLARNMLWRCWVSGSSWRTIRSWNAAWMTKEVARGLQQHLIFSACC